MTDALRRTRNQRDSPLEFHECSYGTGDYNVQRGAKLKVSRNACSRGTSSLALPPAPAPPPPESSQSFQPAIASSTALPENTCATRALPFRIRDCRNPTSPEPQSRVNAAADLAPVPVPSVREAPCPSSPDQFPACTLRKPPGHRAHPRPAELQSPRSAECRKSPPVQKARPQPEEWCAAGADRLRIHRAEDSYRPPMHFPDNISSSNRIAAPLSQISALRTNVSLVRSLFGMLLGIYFRAVRIVCFGSSTIFRMSLGAVSRNAVSRPSASTSPRKTSALAAVVAYTGTAVTRSSGASFCTITPVTVVTPAFSVMRISRACNSGIAVPSIQPSKNQSSLGRF